MYYLSIIVSSTVTLRPLPKAFNMATYIMQPKPMSSPFLSPEDPQLLISIRKWITIDDFHTLPPLLKHVKEFVIRIDTPSPLSHVQQRPGEDKNRSGW